MEWQPIETAPRDGTCVLAFWTPIDNDRVTGRHYAVKLWARGEWINPDELDQSYCDPDLWMPLPPPPLSK